MEFGIVLTLGQGDSHRLFQEAKAATKKGLPNAMHPLIKTYTKHIIALTNDITSHESALRKETRKNVEMQRMRTMPNTSPDFWNSATARKLRRCSV